MRPLRSLLNELVERRLWPLALLLVAGLVAVPLLLAKPAPSGDEGAPAATTPAEAPAAIAGAAADKAATPPGGEPVVSVAQAHEPSAPLRGRRKNPFKQQHLAPTETSTVSSSATTATTAPGSSGGGAPGGSGETGGGQAPKPTYEYASIDVRFGRAGQHLRTIEDVPRLTPLPRATHPIVVFLGMRRDRATAVFLVSTDVHVQGLGQCVPSAKDCEAIELREGETALLDFTRSDGRVEQYELDLDAVRIHTTTSPAVAQRAYARTSRAGRLLLGGGAVHTSVDGIARTQRLPFRWVADQGVLHIAPWASKRARAHRARGAVAGGRLADLTP